ncbi:MAG TPA: DUF1552 domain-containing protein [Polyangiaceae bacterium]|nr:DUF1552 domain-containing protein [Polyangiaceae bacterium]
MRKSGLSRRLFLGGAACAVGLPFFESMVPREARGQAATAPKRFLAYFAPNGFDMADFRPTAPTGPLALGPMMASLEPLKSQLLVLTGLQNTKQDRPMGDHAGGIGSFLSNRTVIYDQEKMGGASIDQVIASQVGAKTYLKSLELSGEEGFADGFCDSGYRCAVGNHIAFDASGTPLPKLFDTAAIFDRLFQGFDPTASAADAMRRAKYRKSVLDNVLGQAQTLQTKLSATDKKKLDEYLNAVREVESRIGTGESAACMPPKRTEGKLDDLTRHTVLADLISLAFQCNLTNVVSLMWGNMTSNRNYAFIGASGGHHDISHHGDKPENISKLKLIGKWEMDQIAALLTKLKNLPDSDGRTVLDNTLVFVSSDISDGDAHNHDDMPVLLAGGGAGFSMGRHLEFPEKPSFGNLFISIANAFGGNLTSFGEKGTAPLSGLTV